MTHSSKPKNSEVDAYTYIKEELDKLGWIVKNPARVSDGEVYKQNEVLYHKELKNLLDRDMPEAVVKLNSEEFWAIESKRDRDMIEQALDEAKNQYAKKINKSKKIKCVLISGVAGNDTDGYIVKNQYLKNGKWENVLLEKGKIKNILLSKKQAQYILEHDKPEWSEFPDLPEEKYIDSALEINEILHNAGINKNKRARFIAGLVLSLADNSFINLKENDTTTLVESVNSLINKKLREVEKESFFNFLKLELPPSRENHIKYRDAIKETIKELEALDIKNAMASGKDILGEFYEKFLKYGNGAKEIGIVLTPRHITEFAVEVLDVNHNDYVLDPTCGTGGFLVSSFDHIKKNSSDKQIEKFKNYNLFGIEQDDEVVALALVNMIFRGDGRNNMSEGNCFQKNIELTNKKGNQTGEFVKRIGNELTKNPVITKVLMNPPFALKKGDEKERHFIDHALSQMQDGGILFAIVPISVMVEGGGGKSWRKDLLENNTLLSVVTLPEDLFYPVSVGTIGVFIKKGVPHNFNSQNVYFARGVTDGYRKKKGKRIFDEERERNQIKEIKEELKAFLVNQNLKFEDAPEFKKICKLDNNDVNIELTPEVYIDNKIPDIKEVEEQLDNAIKESLTYLIKTKKWRSKHIGKQPKIKFIPVIYIKEEQENGLCIINKKTALPQNSLEIGNIPYVTTSSLNNGVSGYYDEDPNFKGKCLTVALNGSVGETFFQFDDFITSGDNAVLTLKNEYNPYLLFYISVMIKNHQWRYNYYRKLNLTKLKKMNIPMPFKNDKELDLEYIKNIVENSYGFDELKKYLK
ncbi:MAG: N-6 DNA methylase [Candidatus Moranbacteria bacterium GW2011_GWE2_35_2-]|nr:MAG: N-6 DNA methylase [Candidatus Moranbacteria bacterium GW2011_GWE2_35_2-]KKQ22415.1 MAG: N-6 DNA methylase [Candidatus Moranbacteria bacterium GW2011_GWF2_37_11]KKQ29483.1 MAG: N-6 DNA methylase [Candidatus Moranbacteria bacterium GW2011_GWD1_37_17]KKQ30648.1 MAG: N-6 DNA methylase [Candidatus Moranbacteria bacterium GW2011_GWE1_37_24]KKQ47750.1 MAG: N-6 DNA methylase [Candidatus Moranbacteria bacterium GW2011_GWD2_37_9]HBO17109.1 DNA methyltransferase [Candidatus Moranbacteria bacteriu